MVDQDPCRIVPGYTFEETIPFLFVGWVPGFIGAHHSLALHANPAPQSGGHDKAHAHPTVDGGYSFEYLKYGI
jgi:hypothetical protein